MDAVQARINEWEASGLIDPATADRLRESERARPDVAPATRVAPATFAVPPPRIETTHQHTLSSVFGPGVTVGEMFAYLGVGFLLAAWSAFVIRLAGEQANTTTIGLGAAVAAAALIVLALVLRQGDAHRRRAAGVAFLVAIGYVASAAFAFLDSRSFDPALESVVVAAAALAAAIVFRVLQPALLTQLGVLISATASAAAWLAYARFVIEPPSFDFPPPATSGTTATALALLNAVGWLAAALILGLLALVDERASPDELEDPEGSHASDRRAALTRGWAGLVAVVGVSSALMQTEYRDGDFGRVIPAWIAEIAVLVLAVVLVERAFRRDSAAFLFAAAVGLITALTDFNFTYLTETTEVGLLIEGGILLAVGFVANRLRRQLPGGRPPVDQDHATEPGAPAVSPSLTEGPSPPRPA